MRWRYKRAVRNALFPICLFLAAFFLLRMPEENLIKELYGSFLPAASFCMETAAYGEESISLSGKVMEMASSQLPLYEYSVSYYGKGMLSQYYQEYVEILLQEAEEGTGGLISAWEEDSSDLTEGEMQAGENQNVTEEEAPEEENAESSSGQQESGEKTPAEVIGEKQLNDPDSGFLITDSSERERKTEEYKKLIHTEKAQEIDVADYTDFEELTGRFYTIDSNTYITSEELDVKKLMETDMRITKGGSAPQILIYHTHSQEGYADSIPGDADTTVVGVGEHLAEILREEYGYQVLHHTGEYDVQVRDYAYSYSLPAIEQLLKDNPDIEVVIDLHRDSVTDGTKLVTEIEGVPTARFMFFNGLSRIQEVGEIDYLPNPNLQANLAFSFQMEKVCEEYYPGLTRKIYLKGYRYNMHLKPRALLVELGAQNNTLQEAMNACGPLARALDMVLSGEG